jgi:hypothetical protein
VIRLGYLDVKRVSRPLSMGLVAITSTEAPGRRGGDKRKNYDKKDFNRDEMSNLSLSIVNLGPLSSLWLPITATPSDMGQGEHSDKLGNNKDKTMNVNQILTAVGVVIAIAAVFVGQLAAYSALILVVLGLVSGFMNPTADMAGRMAYTVAAVAMPTVANQLEAIPAIGAPLNSIIDNIAVMIAGMVVANFLLAVKDSVMASGE